MTEEKKCAQCKAIKPFSKFSGCKASKDGIRSWCKDCIKNYWKSVKDANCLRSSFLYSPENLATEKKCTQCSGNKPRSDFNKCMRSTDGFSFWCRNCEQAKRDSDREKYRETQRRSSCKHRGNENKRSYKRASDSKRRATKLKAIPPWADLDKIKELYAESDRLTRETGIQYSVDHIVPLQGKTVSGFHVHYNLRVIPLRDNVSKGNKLLEELIY